MWLGVRHSHREALSLFSRELAPAGTGMGVCVCVRVYAYMHVCVCLRVCGLFVVAVTYHFCFVQLLDLRRLLEADRVCKYTLNLHVPLCFTHIVCLQYRSPVLRLFSFLYPKKQLPVSNNHSLHRLDYC